jgi:hypothetical protein
MASIKIVLDTKDILEDYRATTRNPKATLKDIKKDEYYLLSVARCLKCYNYKFEVVP